MPLILPGVCLGMYPLPRNGMALGPFLRSTGITDYRGPSATGDFHCGARRFTPDGRMLRSSRMEHLRSFLRALYFAHLLLVIVVRSRIAYLGLFIFISGALRLATIANFAYLLKTGFVTVHFLHKCAELMKTRGHVTAKRFQFEMQL